jgi:hypothetical protein
MQQTPKTHTHSEGKREYPVPFSNAISDEKSDSTNNDSNPNTDGPDSSKLLSDSKTKPSDDVTPMRSRLARRLSVRASRVDLWKLGILQRDEEYDNNNANDAGLSQSEENGSENNSGKGDDVDGLRSRTGSMSMSMSRRPSNASMKSQFSPMYQQLMKQQSDSIVLAWGENKHGELSLSDKNRDKDKDKDSQKYHNLGSDFIGTGLLHQDKVFIPSIVGISNENEGKYTNSSDAGDFSESNGVNPKYQIAQVCVGLSHTVVLTHDGTVYTAGSWLHGLLGQLESKNFKMLKEVKGLMREVRLNANAGQSGDGQDKVIAVACGGFHSIALTRQGKIYTWGGSLHGKLGNFMTLLVFKFLIIVIIISYNIYKYFNVCVCVCEFVF